MKLFLPVTIFCFANSTQAAISTLTVNAALSPQAADFIDQPVAFSQFDPSLGKLQSVRIVVQSTIHFAQEYENTSDQEQKIKSRQTLDFVLELPDGISRVVKDREAVSRTYDADEFDGDIDFDGTSGSTTDYEITSTNQKLLKSREKLAMFTGSGLANLFLTTSGTFKAANKENSLVANAQAFAGAEIRIIYSYIAFAAIPEPAHYGLMAGAVAMVPVIFALSRKKQVKGLRK